MIHGDPDVNVHELKRQAIRTLKDVLEGADSEDVKRKAAVDILSFSEKAKEDSMVTEEQLGWLGKIIGEVEEIHRSIEVSS